MKKKILVASMVLVGLATLTGSINALSASGSETVMRLGLLSGVLGLGSIGLFFVGAVFPKD